MSVLFYLIADRTLLFSGEAAEVGVLGGGVKIESIEKPLV